MTENTTTDAENDDIEHTIEYGVIIRAWGPNDEPGSARYREYVVDANNIKEAKQKAVEEAKNNITKGIIGRRDGYEIVEIETYK